jgi:DinB superfamily/Pentapeptide repeats (8 copies)
MMTNNNPPDESHVDGPAAPPITPPQLRETDLRGSRFEGVVLAGARFEHVDLSGAEFRAVDLTDTRFLKVELSSVVMRGVGLFDVDISGEIERLTINGVDVGPLIEAELDRKYPDRAKMRPTDPAGFRAAWDIVERLWGDTVERSRRLDPELLHVCVDGEWSLIETLRHLVFATDAWIRRGILGDPSPWDALDLPWDEMPDTPGVPRDREARPSLDAVLELRRDRMSTMRKLVDDLTDESLNADTEPVDGPGWPESRSYPVRDCLLVILNEEWEHRLYAERDLDALQARSSQGSGPAT